MQAWQTAQQQRKAEAEQRKKSAAAADDIKQTSCLAALKSEDPSTSLPSLDSSDPVAVDDEVFVPKIYYATRTHSQIAQVSTCFNYYWTNGTCCLRISHTGCCTLCKCSDF